MFVTCLYGIVDPASGRFVYANAGHNLPYARTADGPAELRARGMPLGLLPGMDYEEKETVIAPGDALILYSDGVTEAHSTEREMFGTPRLVELVAGEEDLIDGLLTSLERFTGADLGAGGRHHARHAAQTGTPARAGDGRRGRAASRWRACPGTSATRWSACSRPSPGSP